MTYLSVVVEAAVERCGNVLEQPDTNAESPGGVRMISRFTPQGMTVLGREAEGVPAQHLKKLKLYARHLTAAPHVSVVWWASFLRVE